MIGGQDGAYENFREFIDAINTPEHIVLEQMKKEALYQAISALSAADQLWCRVCFLRAKANWITQGNLASLSLRSISGKSASSNN